MKLPEYITPEEVARVCDDIGMNNWSTQKDIQVSIADAQAILDSIDAGDMKIDVEELRNGLEVELEHGTMFPEYNVTNNHPILTAMIVMAHFKESLDYYKRLEVAEIEGDMYKAYKSGDSKKLAAKYSKLISARLALSESEAPLE